MIYQIVRGELGTQLFQAALGLMMGALTSHPIRFLPMLDERDNAGRHYLLPMVNAQFDKDKVLQDAVPSDAVVFVEPAKGTDCVSIVSTLVDLAEKYSSLVLDGRWCSEQYWEVLDNQFEFEGQLRLALMPRFDDPVVKEQADMIAHMQCIGIHIKCHEAGHRSVTREAYYRNALSEMRQQFGLLPALVFADDCQVAHAIFRDLPEIEVIQCNAELPTFDLYMLSQCRHLILTDSPLSFWAAMLGVRSDAVIYFPGHADTVQLGRRGNAWRMIEGALQGP